MHPRGRYMYSHAYYSTTVTFCCFLELLRVCSVSYSLEYYSGVLHVWTMKAPSTYFSVDARVVFHRMSHQDARNKLLFFCGVSFFFSIYRPSAGTARELIASEQSVHYFSGKSWPNLANSTGMCSLFFREECPNNYIGVVFAVCHSK